MPCKTAYVSNCKYNYIKSRCENCCKTLAILMWLRNKNRKIHTHTPYHIFIVINWYRKENEVHITYLNLNVLK